MQFYGDPMFTVSTRSEVYLNLTDLNSVQSLPVRETIVNLKIGVVLQDQNTVSKRDLERICGGHIPAPVFDKIKKIALTAKTKFHKNIPVQGVQLETFLANWHKGSKKFRWVLLNTGEKYVAHNIVKFASNMETVITIDCAVLLNKDWNKSYYSNELRTFIFKFHNNTLPINTVLSHFARGVSRNCTFCSLELNPDPVDESAFHLFYDCPTVERSRKYFFKWLANNDTFLLNRHEFFCCGPVGERSEIWITILYLFKFYLWECKKRNTLPVMESLKTFVLKELNVMTKVSKKMATYMGICGLNLNVNRLQW
jgi:hypothetical protein